MRTLYLCGGINGLSDSAAKDWRELTKTALAGRWAFLDPMRRDYRGREGDCSEEIVYGDLTDIDNSHALLINATRPSWGTAMEVFYAFRAGKRVVAFCGPGAPSPWLVQHTTERHADLMEAIAALW